MHELLLHKRLLSVPVDDEDEIGGGGSSSRNSILPNNLSKQWGSCFASLVAGWPSQLISG
jgi:hypothetical protein